MNLEHAKRMLEHLEAQAMTTTGKTSRPPMEQKLADAIAHAEALIANPACVNLSLQKKLTEAIADWQKLRAHLEQTK